jgi:hypothetical protein
LQREGGVIMTDASNTSGLVRIVPDVIPQVAAVVASPEGQAVEAAVTGGLPRVARGLVYSVGGGLAAIGSSLVSYDLANPGVLPGWLSTTGAILAPILAAFTGGTAWANLGKK